MDNYELRLEGPSIHFDNFEAGRLVAKHLVGQGCKRLLYMTHSLRKPCGYGDFPSDRRFEGFKQGAREHGLETEAVSRYSCLGDFSNFVSELAPLLKKSKGLHHWQFLDGLRRTLPASPYALAGLLDRRGCMEERGSIGLFMDGLTLRSEESLRIAGL